MSLFPASNLLAKLALLCATALLGLNQERFFAMRLQLNQVGPAAFPATYYLTCNGTASVWGPGQGEPDGLLRCWPEALAYRVNLTCEQVNHRGPRRHIRYATEFAAATSVAECLALHGGWDAGLQPCWCEAVGEPEGGVHNEMHALCDEHGHIHYSLPDETPEYRWTSDGRVEKVEDVRL